MSTAAGDIAITRPDGLLASYAVPGQPERLVALKRRDFTDLISEELRRMDADQVFERAVKSLLGPAPAKKAAAKRTADKAPAKKAPAKKSAAAKKSAGEGSTRAAGATDGDG